MLEVEEEVDHKEVGAVTRHHLVAMGHHLVAMGRPLLGMGHLQMVMGLHLRAMELPQVVLLGMGEQQEECQLVMGLPPLVAVLVTRLLVIVTDVVEVVGLRLHMIHLSTSIKSNLLLQVKLLEKV